MNTEKTDPPTVRTNPDFKKGETVIHKGTGEELKITAITKTKMLRCEGIATLLYPSAVEKKI